MPAEFPVSTPVLISMLAIEKSLLDHVPLIDVEESVLIDPTQTLATPVIGSGNGLTVSTVVAAQPVGKV